jgi:excinuclease ABC subunit A
MKWEGAALLFVVDLVHSLGTFSETDWSTRSIVEIAAAKKSDGWFLHLITGHEAYVKFTFRLPGRAFKEDVLASQLKLKPLSDTPGLEGFSRDANRVEVANYPGGQQVVITKEEIDTPEFRAFLKRAVESFLGGLENKGAGVEAAMPWKKDGEKWHLSEKGFPLGRKLRWDRSVLPRLLAVLKDVDDSLEYKWDVRDAITIRPAGSSRFWCRIKTKESDALEAWFIGTRGQMNLASVEGIGRDPSLEGDRTDGSEVLKLRFLAMDQLQPAKLKVVLKAHLKAFIAQFQG